MKEVINMRKIKLYTNSEMTDRGDQYMARAIDLEEMDEDYDYIEYTVFLGYYYYI